MDDLSQFSELEILAGTLIGESEDRGPDFMTGTCCTVVNRSKANLHWLGGNTLRGVCLDPYQYDCWNLGGDRARIINIMINNPLYGPYVIAQSIAQSTLDGTLEDITNTAVSYYDSDKCPQPYWAKDKTPCFIQLHRFYYNITAIER